MDSANKTSLFKELDNKLCGRIVVLGIGNVLRGDDGFGTLLAEKLKGKVDLKVFAGGSAPENYLGAVIREKPETILFIDTLDFGQEAAAMTLLALKDLKSASFFCTHNHSLDFLCSFLKENTRSDIYLLAVQPENINLGDNLGQKLQGCLEELEKWFKVRYPLMSEVS